MKTKLVRIGNSRGVRLPKPLIEQAGLFEDVELSVQGATIVISPARGARSGWAEAARTLAARGEGRLLDAPVTTRFDRDEWEW